MLVPHPRPKSRHALGASCRRAPEPATAWGLSLFWIAQASITPGLDVLHRSRPADYQRAIVARLRGSNRHPQVFTSSALGAVKRASRRLPICPEDLNQITREVAPCSPTQIAAQNDEFAEFGCFAKCEDLMAWVAMRGWMRLGHAESWHENVQ